MFKGPFIRLTFTFPRDYPSGVHPKGTPSVDLDKSLYLAGKERSTILRKLRSIRERRRPCFEACLKYLLTGQEDEFSKDAVSDPFDSSSDESEDLDTGIRIMNKGGGSSLRAITEGHRTRVSFGPNGTYSMVCN